MGISASPVVDANGLIFIGVQDNVFYVLNPDGTFRQNYITSDFIAGNAALDNNVVYFGGFDRKLHALYGETAGPRRSR